MHRNTYIKYGKVGEDCGGSQLLTVQRGARGADRKHAVK